jgi:hypothetical protein
MQISDFFRPRWRHSKWTVRKVAVEKLANATILAKVAAQDEHPEVRAAAIENAHLTDRDVFLGIAKTEVCSSVAQRAIEKLTDESALIEVSRNALLVEARDLADEKLTGHRHTWVIVDSPTGTLCKLERTATCQDIGCLAKRSHGIVWSHRWSEQYAVEIPDPYPSSDSTDFAAAYNTRTEYRRRCTVCSEEE